MKAGRVISFLFERTLSMAGRVVLTGFVLWGVALCLSLFLQSPFHSGWGTPSAGTATRDMLEKKRTAPQARQVLWPHFPASSPIRSHQLEVNGITYMTETWETCAEPHAVLDYYKCQMAARGWRDVTEESYNLKPETCREKAGDAGLQESRFLETYRKITESCLALNRGAWSIHVAAEEIPDSEGWIRVTLCGAATASIKEFADPWLPVTEEGGRPIPKEVDVVEQGDTQRYHTKITYPAQAPAQAFEDALSNLQKGDWRPMYAGTLKPAKQDFSALLVRGDDYGSLSVSPSQDGRGSSVSWTEVTP